MSETVQLHPAAERQFPTAEERLEAFRAEFEALTAKYGVRLEAVLAQPAPNVVIAQLRVSAG